jgi:hypothetical protein
LYFKKTNSKNTTMPQSFSQVTVQSQRPIVSQTKIYLYFRPEGLQIRYSNFE